jgi:hypothetical protein
LAEAAIGHADERVVSRLEHQPHIERDAAVTADILPVGATKTTSPPPDMDSAEHPPL